MFNSCVAFLAGSFLLICLLPESLPEGDRQKELSFKNANVISVLGELFRNWSFVCLATTLVVAGLLVQGMNHVFTYYMELVFEITAGDTGLFLSIRGLFQAIVIILIFPAAKWVLGRLPGNHWRNMIVVR